jgi:DNA polymerase
VRETGAVKYASHYSTFPFLLAYTLTDNDYKIIKEYQWRIDPGSYVPGNAIHPKCPGHLAEYVADSSIQFHAANAGFEISIWHWVCVLRWGWPAVLDERWHDTLAKAACANMPRGLDNLCRRLGLDGKLRSADGEKLTDLLCVPQRAVQARKYGKGHERAGETRTDSLSYLKEHGIQTFTWDRHPDWQCYWRNDRESLDQFAEYNRQDVRIEIEADKLLPDMPLYEQKVWQLDLQINRRGIPVDVALCRGALSVYEHARRLFDEKIAEICYDENVPPKKRVQKCTQRQRIVDWINDRVNFGESLSDEKMTTWLKGYDANKGKSGTWWDGEPEDLAKVKQVIELRQAAGGTAVSKYKAALDYVGQDGRCRGQLLYHGAGPGRWTGKGIQPHNFLRKPILEPCFFDAITRGNYNELAQMGELFGTQDVIDALKRCVRGVIRAPSGKKLVVSDFAGIEARVLQWLAKNEEALQLFRDGEDVYKHAAAKIFDCSVDNVNGDKRTLGKVSTLALGYGQGAERFVSTCEDMFGIPMDLAFAQEIVAKWRATNPKVVALWRRIERACQGVIRDKRVRAAIDDRFVIDWDRRGYLRIRLPSGRHLWYYKANIVDGRIEYLDGTKNRAETYGAKIVENVTQATARDLLVHSMFLANAAGLPIVAHVHDEIVAEVDVDDENAAASLHKCMTSSPSWAEGLPIDAETHESVRFTKF